MPPKERHVIRNAEIRHLRSLGWKYEAIAAKVGITHGTVWAVCNRKRHNELRLASYHRRQKSPLSQQPPPLTAD